MACRGQERFFWVFYWLDIFHWQRMSLPSPAALNCGYWIGDTRLGGLVSLGGTQKPCLAHMLRVILITSLGSGRKLFSQVRFALVFTCFLLQGANFTCWDHLDISLPCHWRGFDLFCSLGVTHSLVFWELTKYCTLPSQKQGILCWFHATAARLLPLPKPN